MLKILLQGKNGFADISKNLIIHHTDQKIILLNHQANCVENSNMLSNATTSFDKL